VRDDSTYVFTRATSPSNAADDLFLANLNSGTSQSLPFNNQLADDSDPFPVDSEYVLYSCNRAGGKGGWDLFLGNIKTGDSWTLSLFNINSPLHELGVCYTPFGNTTSVGFDGPSPTIFSLAQNYPNPFNPATQISYSLAKPSPVSLKVFDVLGREVATLVHQTQIARTYKVNFNASAYASGIYFYRLEAGDFTSIKKMVLVK